MGKDLASSNAVLKLLLASFRTKPVFGSAGCALGLSMILVHEADKSAIATVRDATLPDNEPDDLRRIHFLRRLRTRVAEIPGKQARFLAVTMAERTLGMLSDHIAYQVLKGDVLALAAHFQGTPELQEVLAEVVQAAGSDMFASDIVYS